MKKPILIVGGIAVLILLLGGAAFVGGQLLNGVDPCLGHFERRSCPCADPALLESHSPGNGGGAYTQK